MKINYLILADNRRIYFEESDRDRIISMILEKVAQEVNVLKLQFGTIDTAADTLEIDQDLRSFLLSGI